MLVALLDELDTECQEHQKAWQYDRDCMTAKIDYHQRQMRAAQACLHRMQNRTLEQSRKLWLKIIVMNWSRLTMREENSRRRRKAVHQTYQQTMQMLGEHCFQAFKTNWHRVVHGTRMEELLCPKITAVVGREAPERTPPPQKLLVKSAGGRGDICNGSYHMILAWNEKKVDGTLDRQFVPRLLNGRPVYKNENGAVIYWRGCWKMKGNRESVDQRWFFSVPGSKGESPPTGAWTNHGCTGPNNEHDEERLPDPPPQVQAVGPDGVAIPTTEPVPDGEVVMVPRMGLMQQRLGLLLFMRVAFVGWSNVKVLVKLQEKDLGNLVSTSANYVQLRRQSINAWIRRARLFISREDYVNGEARLRNKSLFLKCFAAWKAMYVQNFVRQQHVMRTASASTSLSYKSVCFQLWARSSWEWHIERQVSTKILALEETMRKQKEIWSLRIHELKEALKQAKRAQDAPEEQQAKSQYALRKRQLQGTSWPAFFRSPKVSDPTPPMDPRSQPRFSMIGWSHFSDDQLWAGHGHPQSPHGHGQG